MRFITSRGKVREICPKKALWSTKYCCWQRKNGRPSKNNYGKGSKVSPNKFDSVSKKKGSRTRDKMA